MKFWFEKVSCQRCVDAGFQPGSRNCPCIFVNVCSCGTGAEAARVVERCEEAPTLVGAALHGQVPRYVETRGWTLAGSGSGVDRFVHPEDGTLIEEVPAAQQRAALRSRLALFRNAWTGACKLNLTL
jgi:hypothetical protein